MERLSRRNFIKGLAGLGITTELAYATRITKPQFKLPAVDLERLDTVAQSLTDDILTGYFEPIEVSGQKYQPSINQEAIAKTILYLSHLDGGEAESKRVYDFIHQRKLAIVEGDFPLEVASVSPSLGENDIIMMRISTGTALKYFNELPNTTVDQTLFHEVYHVIQQARNPQTHDLINLYLKALIYLGIPGYFSLKIGREIQRKISQPETPYQPRRRDLFSKGAGILAGVISLPLGLLFARTIGGLTSPDEVQAYVQAGGWNPNLPFDNFGKGLLSSQLPENLKGKFFDFKTISI